MINVVRCLDETQEFSKKRRAGCRYGQKKLAKSGHRDVARIVTHHFWGTAAIDDRGIENAPVFDARTIALGVAEFYSRRSVGDVVHFVLVDGESTNGGGGGASGWRIIFSRSGIMRDAPIVGAIPSPVSDWRSRIELLNAIVGVGEDHVLINR